MKNQTRKKKRSEVIIQIRMIGMLCFVVANGISVLIMRLEIATIKPFLQSLSPLVGIITLMAIIGVPSIILTLALFYALRWTHYDRKIMAYLIRINQQAVERKKQGYIAKLKEYKTQIRQIKEEYSIKNVVPGDQVFSFFIELNELIAPAAPPMVKVNGIKASSSIVNDFTIRCYIRKIVTVEDKTLTFSIGGKVVEIDNPYYLLSTTDMPIKWQCKGHDYERKIFLPLHYFPNVRKECDYEFALKIDGVNSGTFSGKYDDQYYCIVIPLAKNISSSQCAGKQVSLCLTLDKANKILLPAPMILTVEGAPVEMID